MLRTVGADMPPGARIAAAIEILDNTWDGMEAE